jgi:hypothetical protein
MGIQVVNGALVSCCMGAAPASLMVLPISMDMTMSLPAANIMAHIPFLNILPFGMCISMSNPMVAAATAAALGVLQPQPCLPMTLAPWTPGSPTLMLSNQPALNNSSILNCIWGGVIQIGFPGEATTLIP